MYILVPGSPTHLILKLTFLGASGGKARPFSLFEPHERRWPCFATSVLVHAAAILALTFSGQIISELAPETLSRASLTRYHVEMLRLRIPERMYLASAAPAAARRPRKPAPARRSVRKPTPAQRPEPVEKAAAPLRRFELPPAPRVVESEQTLLQPAYPLEVHPPLHVRLPDVFFWGAVTAAVPERKQFVQPGYQRPPAQARRLDAPPSLELPGPDPTTLAMAPAPPGASALQFAPAPALPVRTSAAQTTAQAEVADPNPGDPVNVLSISGAKTPVREIISIPAGNQVGRTPGAAPAGSLTGADAPAGALSAETTPASGGAKDAGAPASTDGAKPASGALPASEAGPGTPNAKSAALSAAIDGTRILHPANGVFDIVVQSTGPAGFAESEGMLSGKPVYSVYLAVGSRRSWILQYCIPASDVPPPEVSGTVVRLAAPARLVAPYPRVTFRPPSIAKRGSFLMLHGMIDAAGRFQNLRVLGAHDPSQTDLVVAVLERWEFRPATSEGQPVRVEILLAIPGE